MKKLFILIILLFIQCGPFYLQPTEASDRVSGRVKMSFNLSAHPSSGPTRLWIPYPVSDHYQEITEIAVKGDYEHCAVYTDTKYQRPILFAQWHAGTTARHLQFSFHVKRLERKERELPSTEPCWNPDDYKSFLQPALLVPTDGEIAKLAHEITEGYSTVREKIHAIYTWLTKNMARKPESQYCGDGDVVQLLRERRGNCVDIHSVLVALARASEIPAREVFGIRLGKMNGTASDITKWEHCWAEYFQPGYGWVVIDPADVLKKMLVEKLPLDSPKTQEYFDYFFGSVDPYRIRLGIGRDIILNPNQSGPALNYFMYPYAEAGSKAIDYLDAKHFSYRFIFNPDH